MYHFVKWDYSSSNSIFYWRRANDQGAPNFILYHSQPFLSRVKLHKDPGEQIPKFVQFVQLTFGLGYAIIITEREVQSMRQSAFATYDNRTTHELWCDAMVEKAKNRRPARPQVFVMKPRPVQPEPTYSNYELQKMFKSLLTN